LKQCLGNRCPSKVIKSHNFDAIRKKDIGKVPAPSTVSPGIHKRTVKYIQTKPITATGAMFVVINESLEANFNK